MPKIIIGEAKSLFLGKGISYLEVHKCIENLLKPIKEGSVAGYKITQNQSYLEKMIKMKEEIPFSIV